MLNDESNNDSDDNNDNSSTISTSFAKIVQNEEKEDLINYKSRELIGNQNIIFYFHFLANVTYFKKLQNIYNQIN